MFPAVPKIETHHEACTWFKMQFEFEVLTKVEATDSENADATITNEAVIKADSPNASSTRTSALAITKYFPESILSRTLQKNIKNNKLYF